ncbi:MAG: ABC transporter substrate-binding protein [Holosporales bacterium]
MDMGGQWNLKLIAKMFFLAMIGIFIFAIAEKDKKVLILHSFSANSAWVRDLNIGLQRSLNEAQNLEIHHHHLDLGDNPSSEVRLKSFYRARQVIDNLNPDLIVSFDDEAQSLLASYYLKEDRKIVFSAVNGNVADYGYDQAANVAGIVEEIPLQAMRDALLDTLKEQGGRVIYLSDNSLLSKRDAQRFMEFEWSPLVAVNAVTVDSFEDWKAAVVEANTKADAVVVGYYRRLPADSSDRTIVDGAQVLQWTVQNAKPPLIGTTRRHVSDGLNLALTASPYELGEQAGHLARTMLKGEAVQQKIMRPKYFLVHMREITGNSATPLQRAYEAFAMALHKLVK